MKIFYDHQIFTLQRIGGVSKYFVELMKRIPREEWYTSAIISNNLYVDEENLFRHYHFLPNLSFRGKDRLMTIVSNGYSLFQLHKQSYDIFHQTDYNPYCIGTLKKKNIPFITTCHYLNFATVNRCDYLMQWQKKSMLNADAIVAISENTKKELLSLWNIPENKIEVIYHGVNFHENEYYIRKLNVPYILYVGTRFSFKNFRNLLFAFAKLSQKYEDLFLVCVGSSFTDNELKDIVGLKLQNRIYQFSVSDSELNNLYHYAECFVYPSISEGFGLPLLEAMSNGCPVVCSNISCFPEIAANAAIYFSPFDINNIYSTIETVLLNPSLRADLVKQGKERVRLFSWDKSVKAHLALYKRFL